MSDETSLAHGDGGRLAIARTFRRLRVAMVLVVLILLGGHVGSSLARLRSVERAELAERVAQSVGELIALSGKERGLVAIALSERRGASADEAIARLRSTADRLYARALADARALAADDEGSGLARTLHRLERERERYDAARGEAAGAAGHDDDDGIDGWIASSSSFHEQLLILFDEAHIAGGAAAGGGTAAGNAAQTLSMQELAAIRALALDVAEHAGQERAVVGAAIARSRSLDRELLLGLAQRRGVVLRGLERLDAFLAARTPSAAITAALADVRSAFLSDFESARVEVYANGEAGAPYALTAPQWFELASAGIDSITTLTAVAAREARQLLDDARTAARRRLVAAVATASFGGLLIFFAGGFVRRRVIDRLASLRVRALEVAGGQLELPIADEGADEIGALAGAFEHMRATVSRQHQAQRALIERLTEAQTQLIQQERLASVGQLAGGVAHEVNNPLAIIVTNLEFVEEALARSVVMTGGATERDELNAALRDMREAAERARVIVDELQEFAARKSAAAEHVDDLDDFVRQAARVLAAGMPAGRQLHLALGAAVPVAATRGQLAQLLQRLVDNAGEACAPGGNVTIRTSTRAGHVVIEVEDDGRGIEPERLAHVFEPFYTTKAIGAGPGLGLSVCHGIVRRLGGEIDIESAPARGTKVTIALPSVPEGEPQPRA